MSAEHIRQSQVDTRDIVRWTGKRPSGGHKRHRQVETRNTVSWKRHRQVKIRDKAIWKRETESGGH